MLVDITIQNINGFFEILSQFDAVIAVIIASIVAYTQFRFQAIHTKRLLVIEEAYQKLVTVSNNFRSLASPLQKAGELSEEEKISKFVSTANEMIEFLNSKKIFFNSLETRYIDSIKLQIHETWNDYNLKRDIMKDKDSIKGLFNLWDKIWKSADNDIPKLIDALEVEFKKTLGLK